MGQHKLAYPFPQKKKLAYLTHAGEPIWLAHMRNEILVESCKVARQLVFGNQKSSQQGYQIKQ